MRAALENGRRTRSSAAGFSLVELLIVLMILAIAALIGISQLGKTTARARLDQAARDVQTLAQRAPIEMKMRGVVTYLELNRAASNWQVRLWADAGTAPTAVPTLDRTKATLVQTLDLPSDICLSTVNAGAIEGSNWSGALPNPSDATSRYLICDLLSRTDREDSTNAVSQITGTAVLVLTQAQMLPVGTGSLSPTTKYELHVTAVWSPSLQRFRYTGGTPAWSNI